MKILFISNTRFWPLTTGVSVGNIKLVEMLVNRGHEVSVATPLYEDKARFEKKYNVKLEPFSPFYIDKNVAFRDLKYIIYSMLFTFHLLKLIIKHKYDAILLKNITLAPPVVILKPFYKAKLFISMTDFLTGFLYGNKKYPKFIVDLLLWLEFSLVRSFDAISVITKSMKQELVKKGIDKNKITVTLDGVDIKLFDPEKVKKSDLTRLKKGLPVKENIVMFHGTIDAHGSKRLKQIIEKTISRKKDIFFILPGTGKEYDELKKSLGQKYPKNVKFLGFIDLEDLPVYIRIANLGIVPYERNYNLDMVFTLKLLEYLALGTAVVSTRLKSIEQQFGKFSHVILAEDVDDFVDKIINNLNLGKSRKATELIKKDFTWDKVNSKICDKLEKTIKKLKN